MGVAWVQEVGKLCLFRYAKAGLMQKPGRILKKYICRVVRVRVRKGFVLLFLYRVRLGGLRGAYFVENLACWALKGLVRQG